VSMIADTLSGANAGLGGRFVDERSDLLEQVVA
jgi:hypothetical protein